MTGLQEIWKDSNALRLMVAFACFVSVYFSLGVIPSSLFAPLGFPPSKVAIICFTMLGCGVIGTSLTGWLLDRTHAYKKLLIIYMGISFLVICLFTLQILTSKSFGVILVCMALLGIAMTSVMPAGLGLGIDLTYP